MTEGHESDFLVTVRAQVMTRDESTEGWLPLAGGGLANVSIRKRARLSPGAAGHEYIIFGQRISDQSVILSCVINRDLKYYKVMPTFHHWRAGKQRNGLTFQTAADARAFDKGVLRAYNELIDGLAKSNPSIICPPLTKYDSVGEDDVFMTLDLPVETESIQKVHSSPEGSEKSHTSLSSLSFFRRAESLSDRGERPAYQDTNSQKSDSNEHKPTIHYISSDKSPSSLHKQQQPLTTATLQQQQQQQQQTSTAVQAAAAPVSISSSVGSAATTATTVTSLATQQSQQNITSIDPPTTIAPSENYSYVTLTAVHDYNYPVVDQPATAQVLSARRESITALKKQNALAAAQQLAAVHQQTATPLTAAILKDPNADLLKKHQQQRVRCRYCNELFHKDFNRNGACEFAPDCFRNAIECISGMGCARCMLYHCLSDDEGETPQNPCDCINEDGCTKRWIGLTLLSFFVPCLWCYPPLRACHWIGVSCGICGGKHKPQD